MWKRPWLAARFITIATATRFIQTRVVSRKRCRGHAPRPEIRGGGLLTSNGGNTVGSDRFGRCTGDVKHRFLCNSIEIPDSHGFVAPGARQSAPVRSKTDSQDRPRVSGENCHFLSFAEVPKMYKRGLLPEAARERQVASVR